MLQNVCMHAVCLTANVCVSERLEREKRENKEEEEEDEEDGG